MKKMDVIITGVGGQGNIFASIVISQYAMNKKLNVLGAETIGAAQRGAPGPGSASAGPARVGRALAGQADGAGAW